MNLEPIDKLNFIDGQRDVSSKIYLPPDWLDLAYEDASKPVHLDVGSARGGFCMKYAQLNREVNALGVEYMQHKVLNANTERRRLALPNCFFLLCDATLHLDAVLAHIARRACLQSLSIHFPVPQLQKVNKYSQDQSTILVTPARVQAVAQALVPGGFVFIQSEVESMVRKMREVFRDNDSFEDELESLDEWLPSNPFGVPSEWEESVQKRAVVHRCLIRKREHTP